MSTSTVPLVSSPTSAGAGPAPLVRVESGDSIGRTYEACDGGGPGAQLVAGLGAARRALRCSAWRAAYCGDEAGSGAAGLVLESFSLAVPHLSRASRADVERYFLNTWALTDALFCTLRDDSAFYAIPDALRRPLIFYAAHPATLYANKMHLAGLIGARAGGPGGRAPRGGGGETAVKRAQPASRGRAAAITTPAHPLHHPTNSSAPPLPCSRCRHDRPLLPEAV